VRALFIVLPLLLAHQVTGAGEVRGKDAFDKWCVHCHGEGPGNAGTLRLAIDRGAEKALLEGRKDLTAAYIKLIVRSGKNQMPGYRLLEINDEDLAYLADYLSSQ